MFYKFLELVKYKNRDLFNLLKDMDYDETTKIKIFELHFF